MAEKNYYLTHMTYLVKDPTLLMQAPSQPLTQLVKASTKENADKAVREAAIKDKGEDIVIFSIRVDDLIIGD